MILPDLSCLHISAPTGTEKQPASPTETEEQQLMDNLLWAYLFKPESVQKAEDDFKAFRTPVKPAPTPVKPAPTPVNPAPTPVDHVELEKQRQREVIRNLFHRSQHCETTPKKSKGVRKKPNSWGALRQYFCELTPKQKYKIKNEYGYTRDTTVYREGYRQYRRAEEEKKHREENKTTYNLKESNNTLTKILGLP